MKTVIAVVAVAALFAGAEVRDWGAERFAFYGARIGER